MPNQQPNNKEWEKEFDENYIPLNHSQWKYGAPSPQSLKIFIGNVLYQTLTRERERIQHGIKKIKEDYRNRYFKAAPEYYQAERDQSLTDDVLNEALALLNPKEE